MPDKVRLLLCAFAFLLSGCSTAGPFVTNIGNDGRGGLLVEKCMVHMNAFLGVVSNSDCSNMNVQFSK